MQGPLRGGGPKVKMVAVAAATMAKIATERHVYRERAIATTAPRPGLVQWTTSVPLRPGSTRRLEPKQAQDLLHRDLCANSVEVHARHGLVLLGWARRTSLGHRTARRSLDRSVP